MKNIYLIKYAEGRYEDYSTKIIKAFADQDRADAYKLKYNDLLNRLKVHADDIIDDWHREGRYYDSVFKYVDEVHSCEVIKIELV